MQNPHFGSKIKIPKNMSKSILQIIYSCSVQKNRSKKHQILEKWGHFENRPSCRGYSPCKILTLAQKLKFQKTCQNPFYKSLTVVLYKKPLEKTPNIGDMRAFWKSAIMQRLYPLRNPNFGSKLKLKKTCQSPFCISFRVVMFKKPLEETL